MDTITSCEKEIFGMVHRNIKRLKAEKEDQMAKKQVEVVARLKKEGAESTTATAKKLLSGHGAKYNMADMRPRPRPKHSVPDPYLGATGTYQKSARLQTEVAGVGTEPDESRTYKLIPVNTSQEQDPSHLYSKVNKTKKKPGIQ